MAKRPVDQQEEATAFYADRNFDVSFFPAMWHTLKVGHLISIDLEHICKQHKISIADLHLMGAIRTQGATPLRAADLALWLNVSNAVLSSRVKKLSQHGLLTRTPSANDRRAYTLELTQTGIEVIDAASDDINAKANFVHSFRQLSIADQTTLARIMGELHNELDRYFIPTTRGE